jgi:hypothetical protein
MCKGQKMGWRQTKPWITKKKRQLANKWRHLNTWYKLIMFFSYMLPDSSLSLPLVRAFLPWARRSDWCNKPVSRMRQVFLSLSDYHFVLTRRHTRNTRKWKRRFRYIYSFSIRMYVSTRRRLYTLEEYSSQQKQEMHAQFTGPPSTIHLMAVGMWTGQNFLFVVK